eukprot:Em0014g423a
MASSTHTSLPKPFASGNVREWLTRFDICSDANGWDEKVRAVKLPTLLEGEALATWLDLSDDERKNYGIVKEKLTAAMVSTSFTTLEQFHQRKLVPGEALSLFLHELKQLLDQAMPKLEARAREQLLLHRFVAGLPNAVSRQLRATGDAKELTSTLERAKLLMSLEEEQPVASVSQSQRDCIVAELQGQVLALTEQVAALKHQNTVGSRHSVEHTRSVQCFKCGKFGHIRRYCRSRFNQANPNGMIAGGNSHSAQHTEFKDLFIMTPGTTNITCHKISTNGPPVRVPPRRIPAHFRTEVESQIQHMLQKGIIVESSSSWMAPAVYVRKKSGELRLCVDYRELNKRTHKDAYPLPLVDEVQDRLSGSVIFSKLDLQSGYWQVPVDCVDQEKTAFCPGPGMGLFQFTRMPFGLSGAPSSFQRLMNIIMRGLPFVSTYIDDVLIHSESEELHKVHLREAFKRLRQAGLTLRGVKCQIGMSQVTYLGHVFSGNGMTPDGSKIRAVTEWPKPVDAGDIRQFLGLASYYRRYINRFADLAAPLHQLTWNEFVGTAA